MCCEGQLSKRRAGNLADRESGRVELDRSDVLRRESWRRTQRVKAGDARSRPLRDVSCRVTRRRGQGLAGSDAENNNNNGATVSADPFAAGDGNKTEFFYLTTVRCAREAFSQGCEQTSKAHSVELK